MAALAFVFVILTCPVFFPYGALLNATFSRVATSFVTFDISRCITSTSCSSNCPRPSLPKNTFLLGVASATIGTLMALVIAYLTTRRHPRRAPLSRHRAGRHPRHRARRRPVPELRAAAARALHALILLLAFVTIALPAAYQQLQSAFRPCIPISRTPAGSSVPRGCAPCATSPRLLRTSVIATWCFIFVGVIRELSAAIMLFTSETKVISVLIFDLNESGDLGAISVLGLIMPLSPSRWSSRSTASRLRRRPPAQRLIHDRFPSPRPPSPEPRRRRSRRRCGAAAWPPVRRTCKDLIIDVAGLCLTARNEEYVTAVLAGCDEDGPCTAIGHARGMARPARFRQRYRRARRGFR